MNEQNKINWILFCKENPAILFHIALKKYIIIK